MTIFYMVNLWQANVASARQGPRPVESEAVDLLWTFAMRVRGVYSSVRGT